MGYYIRPSGENISIWGQSRFIDKEIYRFIDKVIKRFRNKEIYRQADYLPHVLNVRFGGLSIFCNSLFHDARYVPYA